MIIMTQQSNYPNDVIRKELRDLWHALQIALEQGKNQIRFPCVDPSVPKR
jgi:hypothetical protein